MGMPANSTIRRRPLRLTHCVASLPRGAKSGSLVGTGRFYQGSCGRTIAGGKATLLVNRKPVAEGRVDKTQPNIFSADETADAGIDNQTPVAQGIGVEAATRFTGRINKITPEVGSAK
jgi:hypothetical protein